MLLISDLDQIDPQAAAQVRSLARHMSRRWDWPYYMALDCILISIDRILSEKLGVEFEPNSVSCRLYERGRGNE